MPKIRKETPPIAKEVFGWMKTAVAIPESFVIEKVGLDATMFLRFLRMSFFLFLAMMLITVCILPKPAQ
jgi:hypothetical protein